MNTNYILLNSAVICAEIVSLPLFSHEVCGEKFYSFSAECKRRSGVNDKIPCLISEKISDFIICSKKIMLSGQMRSYNKYENGSGRLIINVLVKNISNNIFDATYNEITLQGYVCKKPVYRNTPFGKEITDILLAVNRPFGKSDYIPIITWGKNAKTASGFCVGDKIHVEGRLQSRNYEKLSDNGDLIKRTAYEVSSYTLIKLN